MIKSQTYDVSFQKDGEAGKKFFVRIGTAFFEPKTGRISVIIDSIPINWNGRLTLFPKSEGSTNDK